MGLTLTSNKSDNFEDINKSDSNLQGFVSKSMGTLEKNSTATGDKIAQVFATGSAGSPRLFGSNKDPVRADVTKSGSSVLIQIQQNGVKPSPTYASMTIDSSVNGYLNLSDIPSALEPCNIITDKKRFEKNFKQQMHSDNSKQQLVNKVNVFVDKFNDIQKIISKNNSTTNMLDPVNTDTLSIESVENIQEKYNDLRADYIKFRNKERLARKGKVGIQVCNGLNGSLKSDWQKNKGKTGRKESYKLNFQENNK